MRGARPGALIATAAGARRACASRRVRSVDGAEGLVRGRRRARRGGRRGAALRALLRPRITRENGRGETRGGGRLEHLPERQLDGDAVAQPGHHLRDEQGMAAEIEEIVVHREPGDTEHLDQISTSIRSSGVRGGTGAAAGSTSSGSGAGSAPRSSLRFGVRGSAASRVMAAGTRWAGRRLRA